MKLVVALVLITTQLTLQKSFEELDKLEETVDDTNEKCMQEHKLHYLPDYFSSEEDDLETLHCFVKCRQETLGVGTADGTLNIDEIQKIVDQFKDCNEVQGENECETAYKVYKCSKKVLDELNTVLAI